jgi:2-oxo-3-hexenedioate decarboxylase
MHGALRFGDPLPVVAQNRDALFAALKTFVVTLSRNGEIIGSGCGSNVLDGPLSAVRHLTEMLAGDPHNPALAAGEIVTTGTLTPAYPVKPDETWSTSISGMPIAGISMRFG